VLTGDLVTLRPATDADVDALVAIRVTPEVFARWAGDDLEADVRDALADPELHVLAVVDGDGVVVGAIQWAAETDPQYRHASVDLYLDPSVHGRGYGADAVRTLCRHLFEHEAFHRIVIDPAADNVAAIRCYEKVGFRRVGVMRQYERGADGTWHDGLLMDLLRDDLR
jgi:aminoglycoside 6'-N-acetyltransferase